MTKNKLYYYLDDDLEKCPEAWAYFIWSKRGPGKTYSALNYMYENRKKFIFMKRTIKDVEMLCKMNKGTEDTDFNPFMPLNRDKNWNVRAFRIAEGLAAFYDAEADEDGNMVPVGTHLGYILAATAASNFKGFDMSDCDYIIYDEFIPRPWDRVNRREGDQILDLYLTVARDRLKRGREELKLICLANATSISNPMFYTMDLIDTAAEMNCTGQTYYYDEYRGIFMHQIDSEFDLQEGRKKSGIERAMENTPFGAMAFGGKFGYNDFSALHKANMKGYTGVCSFIYKKKNYYIWMREGRYYITFSKHNRGECFDLDKETEIKRFYVAYVIDIRNEAIDGKVDFEKYSMYDLILNYKKIFDVS